MPGHAATIPGSSLKWRRVYKPKTRQMLYAEIETDLGFYRLTRTKRDKGYKVSWAPRDKEGGPGQEVDLGEYRLRRECDERLLKHEHSLQHTHGDVLGGKRATEADAAKARA